MAILPEPALAFGSSPLTRGAHEPVCVAVTFRRLIPAHAGSTSSPHGAWMFNRAHPRSRGEHHGVEMGDNSIEGSSPLTRGARRTTMASMSRRRLIPAHAGSTTRPTHRPFSPRAHPRSRGEHPGVFGPHHPGFGSSPLTRGARTRCYPAWSRMRLIPAHAGSTSAWSHSIDRC